MNLDFSFYSWQLVQTYLLQGLQFSLQLTLIATAGGVLAGTVLALLRLSGKAWLAWPAAAYVNLMRSVPLVMVLLWFFLVMPFVLGHSVGAELSAIISFIAFEAAFFSEIMRSGIQSVARGQVNAGRALGLTYAQNMQLLI